VRISSAEVESSTDSCELAAAGSSNAPINAKQAGKAGLFPNRIRLAATMNLRQISIWR
jgi:hypothetical protein